jgi:hypothetical protein
MKLFFTGFLQVFLVAINTIFLAKGFVLGIVFASFGINWVWMHNIKKTVFCDTTDKLRYASGATTGSLTGYYFSKLILSYAII